MTEQLQLLTGDIERAIRGGSTNDPACIKLMPPAELPKRWMPDKHRDPRLVPALIADIARDVCLGRRPWPLYFFGETGSGKTCTSLCMTDFYGGLYYTLAEWTRRVSAAQFGRLHYDGWGAAKLSESDVWREWTRARFVVLDELGETRTPSDHEYAVVKRSIDLRENRPAVFISNWSLSQLIARYDDRIGSRLAGGTKIMFRGDRRLHVKT